MTQIIDKKQNEIVEWFMETWRTKDFPHELDIKDYSSFRRFSEFWLSEEHVHLLLEDVILLYLKDKNNASNN